MVQRANALLEVNGQLLELSVLGVEHHTVNARHDFIGVMLGVLAGVDEQFPRLNAFSLHNTYIVLVVL